jgi:hypothetical protein
MMASYFKTILIALFFFFSTSLYAEESVEPRNTTVSQTGFQVASAIQTTGRVLSWVGLISGSIGVFASPEAFGGGTLAQAIGILSNGIASTVMVKTIKRAHPNAPVSHRGWGYFGLGCGMIAGAFILGSDAEDYDDFILPGSLLLAGNIMSYISWARFSASAEEARNFFSDLRFSLAPIIAPAAHNGLTRGLQLAVRF